MAEDWQDALLSTRHSHNRTHKSQRRGKARGKAAFTPTSAFGSYSIICKKLKSQEGIPEEGAFEILNLTKCGNAFHVECRFGEALRAPGIMAPSRKILADIRSHETGGVESSDKDSSEEESGDSEEEDGSDGDEENSSSVFEKNTFRVPKFWLSLNFPSSNEENGDIAKSQDLGYIVFSHNDCRKFSGTLSCQSLSWDNVPVQGRKITSRPARDPVAEI